MNLAFLAFLVSATVSLLSFTLIASRYVVPRLSKQPYVQALLPLVLLNVFRTEGFVFLLPQVMGGALPSDFAVPAAYGDVSTAVLALLTALVLWLRPGLALPLVWLLNIVGFADLLFAIYNGTVVGFPYFHVGVAWFIPTVYVPLLLVNHVVVFWFLLRVVPSAVKIAPASLNALASVQEDAPNRQ
jgi:hypothetical protein